MNTAVTVAARPARRSPPLWWRFVVVALVVIGLCPGGWGFVEDAVHLVDEGHLVDAHDHGHVHAHTDHADHVDDDGDDNAPGDEHGCSGAFHTCGCHAGAVFVTALAPPLVLPLVSLRELVFVDIDGDASADHVGFDRPPRA